MESDYRCTCYSASYIFMRCAGVCDEGKVIATGMYMVHMIASYISMTTDSDACMYTCHSCIYSLEKGN